MSWDYVCRLCGCDYFTAHPDVISICYGCWSTKLTEAERQRILPGATPVPFYHMSVKQRGLRALREDHWRLLVAELRNNGIDMREINDELAR